MWGAADDVAATIWCILDAGFAESMQRLCASWRASSFESCCSVMIAQRCVLMIVWLAAASAPCSATMCCAGGSICSCTFACTAYACVGQVLLLCEATAELSLSGRCHEVVPGLSGLTCFASALCGPPGPQFCGNCCCSDRTCTA